MIFLFPSNNKKSSPHGDVSKTFRIFALESIITKCKTAVAEKKPRRKKYTADDFAGMWSDEYFMDVDELNKLIRDGRHVKSNRDKIWDEL